MSLEDSQSHPIDPAPGAAEPEVTGKSIETVRIVCPKCGIVYYREVDTRITQWFTCPNGCSSYY